MMNIAYSCDEGYLSHTYISILSLLENNSKEDITIYFIGKEIQKESVSLLRHLVVVKYGKAFVHKDFGELTSTVNFTNLGRHSSTIYSKNFFVQFTDIDRILYIDSDTIIKSGLIDFWSEDLSEYYIAGVSTLTKLKDDLSLNKDDVFINDGVLLMNLDLMRKDNVFVDLLNCFYSYDSNPPLLSEGVLNKVCRGRIKTVHPRFNLMTGFVNYYPSFLLRPSYFFSKSMIELARKRPVIIHFLSGFNRRPWEINCTHPLKNEYLKYKSKSPWASAPLLDKYESRKMKVLSVVYNWLPHFLLDILFKLKNII